MTLVEVVRAAAPQGRHPDRQALGVGLPEHLGQHSGTQALALVIRVHIQVLKQPRLIVLPQHNHTDPAPSQHQMLGTSWREMRQKTGSGALGIKAAHTLQAGAHGRDAQGDEVLGIAKLGGFKVKRHGWP